MLTLGVAEDQAKCRATDGSVKAVVLPLNVGHVEKGITVEFRHKYATTVTEQRSFNDKNCIRH